MSPGERSIEVLRQALRNAMWPMLRRPPKRPGAAGLAAAIPVEPKPRPLIGGAAAEIPLDSV